MPGSKDERDLDACCDHPDVVESPEGMRVCRNCATSLGPALVGQERRAFTREEVKRRRQTEPKSRAFGARTVIPRGCKDAKGHVLSSSRKSYYTRLSKIQGSLISSIERNFWEAKPKLVNLANKLNVPDYVVETAWRVYSEVAKQKLTMGRSILAFTTASLYVAFRIHQFPRMLDEVVEAAAIDNRAVHRAIGLIVRHVLPKIGLKYRPVSPEQIVYRFGNDLELPVKVQKSAETLLRRAKARGLKQVGKDPKGLAAAALYLAARDSTTRRTQAQVAKVARVTEVTLRTQAKQLEHYVPA